MRALTPGVHRVLGTSTAVAAELRDQGWRVATAGSATSTTAFYAELARALDLPAWFGANLDALWDCLTDLGGPTALVLTGWTAYARARPERWQSVLDVLTERTRIDPPFAVLLA